MSDVAAVDPAPDASEPAPAPEAAPESPEAEGQDLAPGAPEPGEEVETLPEPAAPETVEIEIDGRKYRVPADLRDGYMQHADYTVKTQQVADQGRALAEGYQAWQQQAQAHQQHIQDYGELAHTDHLLGQYRNMDWGRLQQEDSEQAQQLSTQLNMLRDKRDQIAQRIQQREHDTRVHAEREHTGRKEHLKTALARDIPSYTPELQGKMNETAIRHGYTQAEIDTVVDPRMMRMLHLAHLGEQVLQRKRAATAQPAPAPVKPVPKVSGGRTPTTGPTDKQDIKDWMRSRIKQLEQGTG